jgi:hypothetical protein
MPLYSAGDLAGRRGRSVAAHVETCDSCRRLAAEFSESREWVRSAAEPPEFGAEFYEHLRSGVLDQIGREERPAGTRRAPLFALPSPGRRLVYAASFALALVACGLALSLYLRRAQDAPSPMAQTPPDLRGVGTPAPAPTAQDEPRPVAPRDDDGRRGPQPKIQLAKGNNPRKTLTLRDRAQRAAAEGARDLIAGGAGKPAPRREAISAAVPPQHGEAARIEIQTADPNIRIIWLTPQKADEAQPKR